MKSNYIYSLFIPTLGALLAVSAHAQTGQKSFTPTKYVYPVTQIDLLDANQGNQTLYKCSGATPADCLVDMTDATALANITAAAQNVAIAAGTYTKIKLSNCGFNTSGTTSAGNIVIRGTATVGAGAGATFATGTTGMAAGTTAADASIPWACGGALVTLPTPIVVTAGSTQSLSLLVDLTNVVYTDPVATSGTGGCFTGTGGAQGLCSGQPLIVPYFGTGTPTFERYYIAHGSTSTIAAASTIDDANAQVNFGIDPAGNVFYVGTLPYVSETSVNSGAASIHAGPDYNASTRTFSTNTDGSVAFQTGGSAEDNRVGFSTFVRKPASGAWNSLGTCKNENSATTWFYQAFQI